MKNYSLNPWEASGNIDYLEISRKFGTSQIKKETYEMLGDCHPLIRRGFYFSHRDFDKWLDACKKGQRVSIVTGRGPSEKMHIGHLVPFLVAKSLQDKFSCEVYIPISDDEKFFVKENLSFEQAITYSKDNILDLIALGFNQEKTFIFQDFVYTDIYKYASKIAKRITYSTAKAVFGLTPEKNIGWSFYPAVQAAHILFPQFRNGPHMTLVPVGIDQDPFIRLSRDVAVHSDFNFQKPAAIHSKFLPSLNGDSKMSSSDSSDYLIYLSDSEEVVKKKIKKYAFSGGQATIEEHKQKGGNPDIDVSFQYLKMLFEESDEKLEKIRKDYVSGKMLTSELKDYLINKINLFLKEHNKRKKEAEKKLNNFILSLKN